LIVPIAPLGYLAQKVAGPEVRVVVLVPPGQSAETWQVLPRQMEDLGRARVYFQVGLPFEQLLVEKLRETFPKLVICDLRRGLSLRSMEEHHDEAEKIHDHGASDPHVWLDPILAKTMAETIESSIRSFLPDRAAEFSQNRKNLDTELTTLNEQIMQILAPVKGREFFVFHPAFGYFADRYGLKQTAVEYQGKAPGAKRLSELAERLKNEKVRTVFAQPQYSTAEARALADSADAKLVTLNDLSPDYEENLTSIARTLAENLQ
jgi:zinc transport system substrate-binding protein